jgi:hypothetical protein
MCPMSVLTTGMPTAFAISGAGSQWSGSMVGLYEHVSAALGGSDYWAIGGGPAAYDNGGRNVTLTEPPRNERTPWSATSGTPLTLMSNTGSGFRALATRTVRTPFQGDHTISPSSRLLAARFNDEAGTMRGYIVSTLDASHSGGTISASATEVGRYCYVGTKPSFSFDERYITYHDYFGGGTTMDADARELGFSGASDSAFANYRTRGAANVYVIDLLTGVRTRVTNMGPGQYALFPHFRSDGWMYFLVRTAGMSRETVVASNVLFHLSR